jgi:tight adherence protein C
VDAVDHGGGAMNRALVLLPPMLAACSVLAAAGSALRRPPRLDGLPSAPSQRVRPPGALGRLGAPVRRLLGAAPDRRGDRAAGAAVVVGIGLVVVAPPLALVWGITIAAVSVRRRRRAGRGQVDALVDELPEVVDLLWLSVAAGLTVPLAVHVVERHGEGRLAAELGRSRRRAELGPALADAIDEIPARLGEVVRPVTRVLAGALRDGTSVAASLERVAGEVRVARRRAAEERARKVSVRLLFPLVVCILPAFALLTVIPLLAGALRGLTL